MNAKQLFETAKREADCLPNIVKTPALTSAVMEAVVTRWISNQDYSMALGFDGDRAISILKTANEAIDMIGDYIGDEML